MKDIENNSNAIFTDITVLESSNLNVITSNSISLFGESGQVRISASPSTANYNLILPNSIGTSGQLLATDGIGSSYWTTSGGGGGGGSVSSVGVSVPSIFNVSGSPITTSGTIAITTTTSPTGSGAIVLRTQPTIQNPNVRSVNGALGYVGINALDSTVPDDTAYTHIFGKDDLDSRNNLKIITSTGSTSKYATLQNGTILIDIVNDISANTRRISLFIENSAAKVDLSRNDATGVSNLELLGDSVKLFSSFSDTVKTSILTTTRLSGQSNVQAISSGTTGQVLTTLSNGGLAFQTPSSGGSVSSVGVSVPSILNVSGSPITTSGTIAITTATSPTGSGAIVLNTQPSIQNPNVTGSDIGGLIVGINALDSTLFDDEIYYHYFGRDTIDLRNYLQITTSSGSVFKNGRITVGDMSLSFIHNLTQTTKKFILYADVNSKIEMNFNSTTNLTNLQLFSDSIRLNSNFSDTTKTSLLTTTRISGESNIAAISSGTTGQVLTTLSNGGLAFQTPSSGGSVSSVGVSVPSILNVSGSPITTSGTIAITTATTPTGSGAIVLRTQPTISNPTITAVSNGDEYVGINALDSAVPDDMEYVHLFGRDTLDARNYLRLSTSSDTAFKSGTLSVDTLFLNFNHLLVSNSREITLNIANDSKIVISRNDTTGISKMELISDVISLPSVFSDTTKTSLLTTTRVSGQSNVQTIAAGTTGQVLTVQGDGSLNFSTPASSVGTVTSVGLAVPSIFTITGSPVTTSGTLTIGLTNTATGSGGLVLRTNPIMTRPTIGSSGGIGIIAIANTTVGNFNTHQFGCATTEALLFLEVGTLSTTVANTDRFSYLKCGESQVTIGQNTSVGNYIRLNKTSTADVTILLPTPLSSASAKSLLSTTRNGSDSQVSSIPAGTIGQVLTVQSGGDLTFETPGYTTQTITSKVKNTIYQNTTSKPIMATINFNVSEFGEGVTVRCDIVTPPVIKVVEGNYYSNQTPLTFIVLPGYYYRLESTLAGSPILWVEWN